MTDSERPTNLSQVMAWVSARPADRRVVLVVPQDEFSKDVVVVDEGGRFIAYEVT